MLLHSLNIQSSDDQRQTEFSVEKQTDIVVWEVAGKKA